MLLAILVAVLVLLVTMWSMRLLNAPSEALCELRVCKAVSIFERAEVAVDRELKLIAGITSVEEEVDVVVEVVVLWVVTVSVVVDLVVVVVPALKS